MNNGKYSTSSVEENQVKGKGFEPSPGLKYVGLTETLDLNLGHFSENEELACNDLPADNEHDEDWKTSKERPNEAEDNRNKTDSIGEMSDQQSEEEGWSTIKSRKEQKKQREENPAQVRRSQE